MAKDEAERFFIEREAALNAIRRYGDEREEARNEPPAWTAEKIARRIEAIDAIQESSNFFKTTKIRRTFTGLNITTGECDKCGAKLIWYTQNRIKRCPYCAARWKVIPDIE